MLTDAHCHPFDLEKVFPGAEAERRRLGVLCAASATDLKEFEHNEELSRRAKAEAAPLLLPCFALHPQLPAAYTAEGKSGGSGTQANFKDALATLETLAGQGRLAAIGETGFDLYNAAFKETEKIQDELFAVHLETALHYELPLVLHVRRAMHKVFAHARVLKKCKSVIFHSWSGTLGEGETLLKKGVNAFFSFGTTIMLNHHEAMRCCAVFHLTSILTETDAPYQPLCGSPCSSWGDLPRILAAAAALRRQAGTKGASPEELEVAIETNFKKAFGVY
ncbi:TatD family hydrolase [Spirochaetia bacterium]|nr:TatD family hydrolase [Spirochaetia bacterium]